MNWLNSFPGGLKGKAWPSSDVDSIYFVVTRLHCAYSTFPMTTQSLTRTPSEKVTLLTKFSWCWENLCRLLLIKVWVQMTIVLCIAGWWLMHRDSSSTLSTVAITLVLGSWMMNRERIRNSLAGETTRPGWSCRVVDDWTSLQHPLRSLDELNRQRELQQRKDKFAFRFGIVCSVLAGVIAVLGFQN